MKRIKRFLKCFYYNLMIKETIDAKNDKRNIDNKIVYEKIIRFYKIKIANLYKKL
jgi:hypothetical protein